MDLKQLIDNAESDAERHITCPLVQHMVLSAINVARNYMDKGLTKRALQVLYADALPEIDDYRKYPEHR